MVLKKVQSQIIFILVILFVLLAFLTFFIWDQERKDLIEDAKNEIKSQTHSFNIVSSLASQSIINYSKDYSCWDEHLKALRDHDERWMEANVFSSLTTFNIQTVGIYDRNFDLQFSACRSEDPDFKKLPMTKYELKEMFSRQLLNHFFILSVSKKYLLEIAAASMHPTLDMKRHTSPQGYFIAARYWSKDYISSFSDILKSKIEINISGTVIINEDGPFTITSSVDLRDWKGNIVSSVKLTNDSQNMRQSTEFSNKKVVYLGSSVLVIFIFISFFLIYYIFSPLRKITLGLQNEDKKLLAAFRDKDNEFAELARLITSFFRQKKELIDARENLEKKVQERTNELEQKNEILLVEEKALKESYDRLHELTVHLQTIREEERSAISRYIHDDLGQVLTALNYELSMLRNEILSQDSQNQHSFILEEIEEMQNMITSAIERIRKMIRELRTDILDNLGLVNTIKWQLDEFEKRTKIKCILTTVLPEIELDRNRAIAVFRIFQEALSNIEKNTHAKAAEIRLLLDNGHLVLEISDDANSFVSQMDNAKDTIGITGMRERATICKGVLELITRENESPKIVLKVPYNIAEDVESKT